MKFKNYRLLVEASPDETPPTYFLGIDGVPFEGTVVGKLRPWDTGCKEYVLYEDGDLMIAEIAE